MPPPPLDPALVVALLKQAAELHRACPLREGATVVLPDAGHVVMTGDLHDHGDNFRKILKLAALDRGLDRHVILHEMVHPSRENVTVDHSLRLVAQAAALTVKFPGQVHVLLSNHELAQVRGEHILKDGRSVLATFNAGVAELCGEHAEAVHAALRGYVRSLPLAVRLPYGVLCCHSLPAPRQMATFDTTVLGRELSDADYAKGGAAHALVWGRRQTLEQVEQLAEAWEVDVFVVGHQPAEEGHFILVDGLLVLASDHERGVALPMDLSRPYRLHDLAARVVPLQLA